MADYETDEMLTRLLAIERLKKLSDLYMDAAIAQDGWTMKQINQEREELKRKYLKVVK